MYIYYTITKCMHRLCKAMKAVHRQKTTTSIYLALKRNFRNVCWILHLVLCSLKLARSFVSHDMYVKGVCGEEDGKHVNTSFGTRILYFIIACVAIWYLYYADEHVWEFYFKLSKDLPSGNSVELYKAKFLIYNHECCISVSKMFLHHNTLKMDSALTNV